jgi:DeoR/GlpR family transcriptional regulator of sugar metabolism
MVEVAHVAKIDTLFTDAQPPEPFNSLLKEVGASVVIAAAEV